MNLYYVGIWQIYIERYETHDRLGESVMLDPTVKHDLNERDGYLQSHGRTFTKVKVREKTVITYKDAYKKWILPTVFYIT